MGCDSFDEDKRSCNILKLLTTVGLAALIVALVYHFGFTKRTPARLASPFGGYNLSTAWETRSYPDQLPPIPVHDTKHDRLIHLTGSLDRRAILRLNFPTGGPSCLIPLQLAYNSINERSAVSLGNGAVVVALLNNHADRTRPATSALMVDWRVFVLDPGNCSLSAEARLSGPELRLVQLLGQPVGFDALLANMDETAGPGSSRVSRYDARARLVPNSSVVIPDEEFLALVPGEAGYYYVAPLTDSQASAIRRLDGEYRLRASHVFQHSLFHRYDRHAYSAGHGRFTVCYYDQESRASLACLALDAALTNRLLEAKLNFDREVEEVWLKNVRGGALIVYASQQERSPGWRLGVRFLGEDGGHTNDSELGDLPSPIDELYSFEMNDGSVCFAVTMAETIWTKCLGAPK